MTETRLLSVDTGGVDGKIMEALGPAIRGWSRLTGWTPQWLARLSFAVAFVAAFFGGSDSLNVLNVLVLAVNTIGLYVVFRECSIWEAAPVNRPPVFRAGKDGRPVACLLLRIRVMWMAGALLWLAVPPYRSTVPLLATDMGILVGVYTTTWVGKPSGSAIGRFVRGLSSSPSLGVNPMVAE